MRATLLASIMFFGWQANLPAQAIVENAMGTARAATMTAPAAGIGKSIKGIADSVDKALKSGPGAGEHSTERLRSTTARPGAAPPAKPGVKYEDPGQIQAGMTYEEVVRRFGPPSLQMTTGPGATSLAYSGKDGQVQVEIQDGKVASVEKAT